MRTVFLVFPHQLFKTLERLPKDTVFAFIEDELYFRQYPFHQQKLVLHRASMQALRERLLVKGYQVEYFEAAQYPSLADVFETLAGMKCREVHYYDLADDWLRQRVREYAAQASLRAVELISPAFLLTKKDLAKYRIKRLDWPDFYAAQRKRFKILLDKRGFPKGRSWQVATSLKSLPDTLLFPDIHVPELSRYVEEAETYVATHFAKHFGERGPFIYPVTHADAKDWLDDFLHNRFAKFGMYKDNLSLAHPTLFHSMLEPLLAIGLLTPRQVMEAALKAADQQGISLRSQEPFFRFLIGEREYARFVYVTTGRSLRMTNPWKHDRPLTKKIWLGTTGIVPFDVAMQRLRAFGYLSPTEYNLVVFPFLVLCQIDPDEVHRFLMVTGVGVYDWSAVAQWYGSNQPAELQLPDSTTLRSHGDYPSGPWSEQWDALYWYFLHTHQGKLLAYDTFRKSLKALEAQSEMLPTVVQTARTFLRSLS